MRKYTCPLPSNEALVTHCHAVAEIEDASNAENWCAGCFGPFGRVQSSLDVCVHWTSLDCTCQDSKLTWQYLALEIGFEAAICAQWVAIGL